MMKICQASKSEFYANVVFYCQFAGRGKDGHSGQEPARSKKVLALQILLNFLDVLIFGRMFWEFCQSFGRIKFSWIPAIPIT